MIWKNDPTVGDEYKIVDVTKGTRQYKTKIGQRIYDALQAQKADCLKELSAAAHSGTYMQMDGTETPMQVVPFTLVKQLLED